jgi:hypothetical protein
MSRVPWCLVILINHMHLVVSANNRRWDMKILTSMMIQEYGKNFGYDNKQQQSTGRNVRKKEE